MNNTSILDRVAEQWFRACKVKPIQARKLTSETTVLTPEGITTARPGDWLCQGQSGDQWPQKESKLFGTYIASDTVGVEHDPQTWHTFHPRPDGDGVMAAQVNEPFVVEATWG